MSVDDDAEGVDGEQVYRVGAKALGGAVFESAHAASERLAEIVGRLTSVPPVSVRVLESGTVRMKLFAPEAMCLAALMLPVAGTLGEGERGPGGEPVTMPGSEVDYDAMHPTWYVVQQGIDYGPGVVEAMRARAVLRDVLRACLPRGPLAVVPTFAVCGRGAVKVDVTPADAERLAVLLEYVGDLLERGRRARS